MGKAVAIPVAVVAGALVGMQAPVNSRLGRAVGSLQAATFSFLVGTFALLVLTALFAPGGLTNLRFAVKAPWWALVGGLFGAVYVATALVAVRALGASALTAAVIAGQLAIAVVIDRFGLFGIHRQPIAPARIVGLLLLAAGVALVVRR